MAKKRVIPDAPIVVKTTVHTKVFDLIKDKEKRDRVNLSYMDVALATNLAKSIVANYAENRIKRFDAHTVEAFMTYFELTSYDQFFERVQIDDGTQKQ